MALIINSVKDQNYTDVTNNVILVNDCKNIKIIAPTTEKIIVRDTDGIMVINSKTCLSMEFENCSNITLTGNQYYISSPEIDPILLKNDFAKHLNNEIPACLKLLGCKDILVTNEVLGNNRERSLPLSHKIHHKVTCYFNGCNNLKFVNNIVYQESPIGVWTNDKNALISNIKIVYNDKVVSMFDTVSLSNGCKNVTVDGKQLC